MLTLLSRASIAACLAALLGTPAAAQVAEVLKPSSPLGKDFAAFPRVIGTGPAVSRINSALDRADARARKSAAECRAQGGKDAEWTRSIAVTMRGPGYLSFVANDYWDCGGAHPDSSTLALVYDLATGTPANWQKLLPAALASKAGTDTAGDGTVLGTVTSPALRAIYRKASKASGADPSCDDVLADDDITFLIWPDAKSDALTLAAASLPHVVAACADSLDVSMPDLRKLGVNPGLLDAIGVAHDKGWFDKSAD